MTIQTLMPHQQKVVDDNPIKCGLFFEQRVGKTPTSIRLACKNVASCLVIVPKSLKEQWEEEIERWRDSGCKFQVISKETFRRDWEKLEEYGGIIVDECHKDFSNGKNKAYKALESYINKHEVLCLWGLTGTPYTNNCWSVYYLGKLFGKNWDWFEWHKAFFTKVKMGVKYNRWGYTVPNMIPVQKKGIETKIAEIVRSIGVVIKLEDVVDLPEQMIAHEYFDLNKEQKNLIDATWDPLPIVRFTKQHQIESGTLKGDGYTEDKFIECDKTKRIIELCQENKKIAIVARYNCQLEMYRKALIDHNFKNVYVINGATENKNDIIKKVAEDEECIVLINAYCDVGYSIASISVMVFASMSFSFVNYTQMCSRIKAMEKKEPNLYIHLLTRDKNSVDVGVKASVDNKSDFDIEIFGRKKV